MVDEQLTVSSIRGLELKELVRLMAEADKEIDEEVDRMDPASTARKLILVALPLVVPTAPVDLKLLEAVDCAVSNALTDNDSDMTMGMVVSDRLDRCARGGDCNTGDATVNNRRRVVDVDGDADSGEATCCSVKQMDAATGAWGAAVTLMVDETSGCDNCDGISKDCVCVEDRLPSLTGNEAGGADRAATVAG